MVWLFPLLDFRHADAKLPDSDGEKLLKVWPVLEQIL